MPIKSEHRPIPEHWDQRQKGIRTLINEFRDRLTEQNYEPPIETDCLVALSGPPEMNQNGTVTRTPENEARIQYVGILFKEIASKKSGIPIDELTTDDLVSYGPEVVLNGEIEQLPVMHEIALDFGIPEIKIKDLSCGKIGAANTKTQFEVIRQNNNYSEKKHLTYITSSYHVPRVVRTADKNSNPEQMFEIIGVPVSQFQFNVFRKVKGEVKRILNYSEKGDITRFFKEPASPIFEFGNPPTSINLQHRPEKVELIESEALLKDKLIQEIENRKTKGIPVPHNGTLVNVDNYEISEDNQLVLHTSETDYFSYLAASFQNRDNQEQNPIMPLAVSASLLTPEGDIIVEKRRNVTELEGKLGTFGGAMRPGETPQSALLDRLSKKMGLNIEINQSQLSGADVENIQNILELFYVVKLEPSQVRDLFNHFTGKNGELTKEFIRFPASKNLEEIQRFLQTSDLAEWNPSSFYNILYALTKIGYRNPDEINQILDPLRKKINRKPFRYKFPIQNYISE